MEILLVIVIVALIATAIMPKPPSADYTKNEIIREIAKVCPPHKWKWVEIKDHEGTVHAHQLLCEICGPLKPLDGRES